MLKGEAKYWWESSKHLLLTPEGGEVITWDSFIKVLYEKYFPRMYRKQKEREF